MLSGMPILPISWSSAPRRICASFVVLDAQRLRDGQGMFDNPATVIGGFTLAQLQGARPAQEGGFVGLLQAGVSFAQSPAQLEFVR